ncbi:MAG: hypothetical protein A3H67_01165 [Candidatus Buchananbacteria bacterium RIFCSPLOWO2_02_FULL_46_11b]|uniref:Four helix bundle protein n=1 Tax=Candidatus Buchananbacteria bacterium RIFCSPLOWO2_02_FULL_46_11b TaxID=1797548 RepID=A0A1G1Z0U5_9BACT|nr:MAG: hypothetical protein A3H67_01165 [Candidatus Buchananbacteria bacterium RIFCSPLOWO2_02_FULL_46_11b]
MDNEEFKKMLKLRTFNLAREVMQFVDKFPNKRSAWIITDQLLRAIMSIGANIAEAQAASSKKDFINFLNYALKSGNETKFWLALAKDLDNKLISEIDEYLKETDEIVRIIGSSIATLKGKKKDKANPNF